MRPRTAQFTRLLLAGLASLGMAVGLAGQARSRPASGSSVPLPPAAVEALERGDPRTAAKLLEDFLLAQPGHVEGLLQLAFCYSQLDRRADAIELYRELVALDPSLLAARMNLGVLLLEAGRLPEAVEQLRQAAALEPANYRAQLYLGVALERAGEADAALEQYRRAAALDAKAVEPRRAAYRLLEKQHPEEAARLREELLALTPTDFELVERHAAELLAQGKEEEAFGLYERYFEAAHADATTPPSELGEWHMRVGWLYRERGRLDEALRHFAAAIERGGDSYRVGSLAEQARTQTAAGQHAEAVALYRQALALEKRRAELYAELGHALLETHQYGEAIAELRRAIELEPERAETYGHLASALYLSEDWAGALRALDQRAAYAGETPGTYFLRAICHDRLHQREAARANYEKFLGTTEDRDSPQAFQARQRVRQLKRPRTRR